MEKGFAGRIAEFFINSKLTILLMIALMIIGVYSSTLIPREEEPQIIVPMADVMVGYPGASPKEVESRVVKTIRKNHLKHQRSRARSFYGNERTSHDYRSVLRR